MNSRRLVDFIITDAKQKINNAFLSSTHLSGEKGEKVLFWWGKFLERSFPHTPFKNFRTKDQKIKSLIYR